MLEARTQHDAVIIGKDVFRAVAVVHIKIEDRHARKPMRFECMNRTHGDVVENTKTHCPVIRRVMPAGPHRAKSVGDFARHYHVHALYNSASSALCGRERIWVHGGIWIECRIPSLRRSFKNAVHIIRRVSGRELLTGGERCFYLQERRHQSGPLKSVINCLKPRRGLGVMRTHFVPEAIRMRDECGGHLRVLVISSCDAAGVVVAILPLNYTSACAYVS